MDGHLVYAPASGFDIGEGTGEDIGEGTDVEPAHFWSQGPPVNGGRSWQLIVKHDLTHWLHDRKLGVHPSVQVPYQRGHRCGTSRLLQPGFHL